MVKKETISITLILTMLISIFALVGTTQNTNAKTHNYKPFIKHFQFEKASVSGKYKGKDSSGTPKIIYYFKQKARAAWSVPAKYKNYDVYVAPITAEGTFGKGKRLAKVKQGSCYKTFPYSTFTRNFWKKGGKWSKGINYEEFTMIKVYFRKGNNKTKGTYLKMYTKNGVPKYCYCN